MASSSGVVIGEVRLGWAERPPFLSGPAQLADVLPSKQREIVQWLADVFEALAVEWERSYFERDWDRPDPGNPTTPTQSMLEPVERISKTEYGPTEYLDLGDY